MSDKKWRYELELLVEKNLNELILETKEYDEAILKAKNKSKAQVWTALALLNHKIKSLEQKDKTYDKKISLEEMGDILDKLENY